MYFVHFFQLFFFVREHVMLSAIPSSVTTREDIMERERREGPEKSDQSETSNVDASPIDTNRKRKVRTDNPYAISKKSRKISNKRQRRIPGNGRLFVDLTSKEEEDNDKPEAHYNTFLPEHKIIKYSKQNTSAEKLVKILGKEVPLDSEGIEWGEDLIPGLDYYDRFSSTTAREIDDSLVMTAGEFPDDEFLSLWVSEGYLQEAQLLFEFSFEETKENGLDTQVWLCRLFCGETSQKLKTGRINLEAMTFLEQMKSALSLEQQKKTINLIYGNVVVVQSLIKPD